MSNTLPIARRENLLPALAVAVALAVTYWLLDRYFGDLFLGYRVSEAPIVGADQRSIERIFASMLIGLIGAGVAMAACHNFRRQRKSLDGERLMRLNLEHRALIESTFDSVLVVSSRGKVQMANSVASHVFGGDPGSFEGISIATFFSLPAPVDDEGTTQSAEPFDPSRSQGSMRVTALGLDGRTFPAEVRSSEIQFYGARLFVLCVKELSAEFAAQRALQNSEFRYQSLFDRVLDGIYRCTAGGQILAANPAMVRLLGYESEEELSSSVNAQQLYRNPAKRWKVTRQLLSTGVIRNMELELIRKNGEFVTVLANVRAIRSDQEHELVFEGTLSDISAVATARTALQNSEEQFRAMIEHTLDIVTVLDEQGNLVYSSPSGGRISGLQRDDAIGKNVFAAIHRDDVDSVKTVLAKAFSRHGAPHEFTFRFYGKGGNISYLESIGSAYRTLEGKLRVVVHSRDVTERLRTEAQLQQAQKMQAVGQLTGGMAHDFNNLLTVIMGNLQLLEEQITNSDQLDQVQTALRASMQGAELTRRLLAFSRRQFLEPKVINVNDLLHGMEPIIRRSLSESARIFTGYSANAWRTKIDPAQLESALLNLALNASDSMSGDGELSISTANCVLGPNDIAGDASVDGGEFLCITVTDNGCGMSESVLQRAIEPFFSTKDKNEGTGLGLSMVYGFVRQSGGHLCIDSRPDEGTSIRIYLPRATDGADDVVRSGDIADMPRGTESVLVVEDNQDVRESATALLRSLGYKVSVAHSGHSALDALQNEKFQLLFSDVMMPKLSGFDLAKLASQLQPDIRVLLTTGYTDLSTFQGGELPGQFEVLQKPYTKQELAVRVRNQLDE